MSASSHYLVSRDEVYRRISSGGSRDMVVNGETFLLKEGVFPSDEFRSSVLAVELLLPRVTGKCVLDMGCGSGFLSVLMVGAGASRVVAVDINPEAIVNAEENRQLYGIDRRRLQVVASDVFVSVPAEQYDLIYWNPPFHTEEDSDRSFLKRGVSDPGFRSMKSFLASAKTFLAPKGEIILAWSNKVDVKGLEDLFNLYTYSWELMVCYNSDQKYDNRFYRLWL